MSNLSIFNYNEASVRAISVDGEPWFVAKDICKILGLENVSQALGRLDADEIKQLPYETVITLTDDPETTRLSAISESGMYTLVLRSRKPEAKPFRKWVTSEVLPSIRKTGSYSVNHFEVTPELDSAIHDYFAARMTA